MKNIQINLQKVVWILRKQFIKDKENPIEVAMYDVIFRNLKAGIQHEILLKSGAKIKKYDNEYWLCGYAQDGRDVDYYFTKRK